MFKTIRNSFYLLLFVLVASSVTACGLVSSSIVSSSALEQSDFSLQPETEVKQASLPAVFNQPQVEKAIAPVEVEVAQAFFDENTLNIKVHLKTLKEMSPDEILVGVSGLRDGVVVEQDLKKVSEVFTGSSLDSDSLVALRFTLDSKDLSEYQIICVWGEQRVASTLEARLPEQELEADPEVMTKVVAASDDIPPVTSGLITSTPLAVAATEDAVNLDVGELETFNLNTNNQNTDNQNAVNQDIVNQEAGELEISDIDIVSDVISCKAEPCDISYTVYANLINNSSQSIDTVKIAVGLYWANEGQLPKIPEASNRLLSSEELVELSDVSLASGRSQKVKMKLDRNVPQVPGGSFIPHIRLLE